MATSPPTGPSRRTGTAAPATAWRSPRWLVPTATACCAPVRLRCSPTTASSASPAPAPTRADPSTTTTRGASEAWLDEHHPSLSVADLTADLDTHPDPTAVQAAWREWSAWYYPGLLNREVMAMAEREGNEQAFRPTHDGTVAAPPYRDTVDGRGLGRFVYRVRSVDASGNDGAWSAAFPLVEVRDVTAPATPVLQSVLGDRERRGHHAAGER